MSTLLFVCASLSSSVAHADSPASRSVSSYIEPAAWGLGGGLSIVAGIFVWRYQNKITEIDEALLELAERPYKTRTAGSDYLHNSANASFVQKRLEKKRAELCAKKRRWQIALYSGLASCGLGAIASWRRTMASLRLEKKTNEENKARSDKDFKEKMQVIVDPKVTMNQQDLKALRVKCVRDVVKGNIGSAVEAALGAPERRALMFFHSDSVFGVDAYNQAINEAAREVLQERLAHGAGALLRRARENFRENRDEINRRIKNLPSEKRFSGDWVHALSRLTTKDADLRLGEKLYACLDVVMGGEPLSDENIAAGEEALNNLIEDIGAGRCDHLIDRDQIKSRLDDAQSKLKDKINTQRSLREILS